MSRIKVGPKVQTKVAERKQRQRKYRPKIVPIGLRPCIVDESTEKEFCVLREQLEEAKSQNLPYRTPKPTFTDIPVGPQFVKLGHELDMSPHEIDEILRVAMNNCDNELLLSAMKKLISTAKLVLDIDLAPVRRRVRDNRERFDQAMQTWQANEEHINEKERAKNVRISRLERQFMTKWFRLLDKLEESLAEDNVISTLGGNDQYFLKALQASNSTLVKIDNSRVTVNWNKCRKMGPVEITTVLGMIHDLYRQDMDMAFMRQLVEADMYDLMRLYWETKRPEIKEEIWSIAYSRACQGTLEDADGRIIDRDRILRWGEDEGIEAAFILSRQDDAFQRWQAEHIHGDIQAWHSQIEDELNIDK